MVEYSGYIIRVVTKHFVNIHYTARRKRLRVIGKTISHRQYSEPYRQRNDSEKCQTLVIWNTYR